MQGAKLLFNISKCDGKIQEACNISLSNDTSSGFEKCNRIMMDFRWGVLPQDGSKNAKDVI